jgi:hypothetical protein
MKRQQSGQGLIEYWVILFAFLVSVVGPTVAGRICEILAAVFNLGPDVCTF